jgi:hypothetical protein
MFDERMLQRMPSAKPLDRRHARAINLGGGHQAGIDRHAVDQHRARAALSLAAPLFRAGERAVLTQYIQQALQGVGAHSLRAPIQHK